MNICQIRQHPLVKTASVQRLKSRFFKISKIKYLKSRLSLSQFNQLAGIKNKHKCSFFLQFISVTYS